MMERGRWNLHDVYLKTRYGHDRLWIGMFGIDPYGNWVGYRLMPDDYIQRAASFLALANVNADGIREQMADVSLWDGHRWDHWRSSFGALYSDIAFGEGRYVADTEVNMSEREQTLDDVFEGFVKDGPA